MKKEEVIKYIIHEIERSMEYDIEPTSTLRKIKEIVEEIEENVPDNNVDKWIPVSERLPEVAQRVIFCRKNNEICIGTLHTYENDLAITLEPTGTRYVYSLDSVIAWMSLPEPYTESEE